jgi:phospho-N-acetylmuramoyl-pentapeptide-transferase
LGGLVVGLAFLANSPLIIVLAGIVYIAETLSVILQVASFKLTGKRIFKMSPIHHHFEKSGWSEIKIVGVFSLVTLIFCVISYWGMM